MTRDELKKMQVIQLDIMDDIHRICCLYNIGYYIIGGTAIGAMRHKGFIPWDIDIDIAMLRNEYERFKEICKTELNRNYQYYDYCNVKNYIRPHAIVADKNTIVHFKYDQLNPKTEQQGVFVDIFPLDNAPNDEKLRCKHIKQLKAIALLKRFRIPYCYSNIKWKRIVHHIISVLLSPVSVYTINEFQQKTMKKYQVLETECVCSMASQYAYSKQCIKKDIYGEPTLIEFEGRNYYAPERCTEYLTLLYGDYMKLPPEEKRRANMDVFSVIEFL